MKEWKQYLKHIGAIAFLLVIIWLDDATGAQVPFLFFYFVLVLKTAYQIGGWFAYLIAAISACARTQVSIPVFLHVNPGDYVEAVSQHTWLFINIVSMYFVLVYLIDRQKKYINELKQSSLTDPLTGLRNRRAFHDTLRDEVAASNRHKEPLELAYIDIDGFKAVNDTYGHQEGDRLLKIVGDIICDGLREEDRCFRLGGDEFAIIFKKPDLESHMSIKRLKRRLDMEMCDHEFDVSFSIGSVCYTGYHPLTEDRLIQLADQMMYDVKKDCKNAIRSITV